MGDGRGGGWAGQGRCPETVRIVKIVHVYKDYHPVVGGIENHVRMLAEEQARRGLDVSVLVTSLSRRTTVEHVHGVRVIKAARLAHLASTPLSLSLVRWVRQLRTDVVHLHFPYPLGELANMWLGRAHRTVITYHSDVVRQRLILKLYGPLLRRVLATADRVIATSPNYVRTSPYLARVASKCEVVPLGIDVDAFSNPDPKQIARIRQRWGSPLLLFVGRLRYYKGLDYLIRSMQQLDVPLLVVGSGPMEQRWKSLARRCGVADRVHFLGHVDDRELPAYYASAHLFILPASHRSEAFSTVLLEAMAAGVPAISTELGTGTSFVNLHCRTGLVVPARDTGHLTAAIQRLLSNESLRDRLAEQARARARSFPKQRMADDVIALYRQLLDHDSGPPANECL